jgi:(R)-2-hydroxyacyl-CoA dehydratese activating ATPase
MADRDRTIVAGMDVGTECVKVVIHDAEHRILGRAVVPTRGYFEDCIQEATGVALNEAQLPAAALRAICATGFAANCATTASLSMSETACHARGALLHIGGPTSVIDIGGRDPKVINLNAAGAITGVHGVRKCAVGIGTFLMFAARHLDVHPTRLMDLATSAEKPARVGSYCSIFAEVEVIDLLRSGASAGEIALGCMHSIAERILEMRGIQGPMTVTGGVCEYFPGVITALAQCSGLEVRVVPEPILTGALGAALFALDSVQH